MAQVKWLNRTEFVVVGWTDPEGRRPHLGALLLAYYDPGGRLMHAGRVGTGMDNAELERLWRRLAPLATDKMPLDVPPPRSSRFTSVSSMAWTQRTGMSSRSAAATTSGWPRRTTSRSSTSRSVSGIASDFTTCKDSAETTDRS